jgi:hypothetical protein
VLPSFSSLGSLGSTVPTVLNNAVAGGKSEAAASAIAVANSRGQTGAAADALVQQFGRNGRGDTVAQAVAIAAGSNAVATASVLAQTASTARSRGYLNQFARSQARAFAVARSRGRIDSWTQAVAQAIQYGGRDTANAYGVAIAQAAAGSSDEQEAVAEATAVAFCNGGARSRAFAQAYSQALSVDPYTGCLTLSRARAIAIARCNGGVARTYTQASAESRVLGFCRQRYPNLPGFSNYNVGNFVYGLSDLLSGIGGLFG